MDAPSDKPIHEKSKKELLAEQKKKQFDDDIESVQKLYDSEN